MFQWYLEHFHKLSYSDLSDLYIPEIADELQPAKEEVVQLIKETLANKKFEYRGEYTTFMKYVYVYLTGKDTFAHRRHHKLQVCRTWSCLQG